MNPKKYSIIVRIYNAEKYLRQCIESVIAQTYTNWELLLVNDGSTDSSLSICNEYAQEDTRIKVISQENQGGVKAQITGFEAVTGDYVCGLDADDWYENNLIKKCNDYFENNSDIDLVLFGYKCIYEDNHTSLFTLTEENKLLDTQQLVDYVMTTTVHALWLKIFKKELINYSDFEKEIIRTDAKKFRFNNDLFLCIPLLFNSKKALVTNEILYDYRILSNSSSHKKNPYNRISISFNTMEYLYKIFEEKKFLNSETELLIIKEIYREVLPEFYNIFRHFQIKLSEIKKIKKDFYYKKLVNNPQSKAIVKTSGLKFRIAFNIFTKVL